MARGSLENHLFRRGSYFQPLSWNLRMKVALGAAKGLAFLHSAETQVIYRDFKTSNILLDSKYNTKLSDFGLAKDGPTGDKSHVSTRVMGTYGYAAPEYLATGINQFGCILKREAELYVSYLGFIYGVITCHHKSCECAFYISRGFYNALTWKGNRCKSSFRVLLA